MDRRMDGWTDGWMDGRMDGRTEFPPVFYRTSSPIGSAALPTSSFSTTAYGRARVPLDAFGRLVNELFNDVLQGSESYDANFKA